MIIGNWVSGRLSIQRTTVAVLVRSQEFDKPIDLNPSDDVDSISGSYHTYVVVKVFAEQTLTAT